MTEACVVVRFGRLHGVIWAVTWAAMLCVFWPTAAVIVDLWRKSDTYAHAFLVLPIVAWLVWRARGRLAAAPVQPEPWLLAPMVAVGAAWLLSELANVGVVGHFALATLLILTVPAMFGWAVARAVAFPLAFVYFAVPFGDALLPSMMEWTADVTVWALVMTGIPVYREGLHFMIPTGMWSVVEACSGLRYLIASLMVGSLFAYLTYSSWTKRAIFIAASIAVPVLANWARAYLIVMVGHLSSNKLATGVDHLVYGWVFFGIVIGIMFVVGARFADVIEAEPKARLSFARPTAGVLVLMLCVLVVGGVTRLTAVRMDEALAVATARVGAPMAQDGWQIADGVKLPFTPGFRNPAAASDVAYRLGDLTVYLWIGYYRQQGLHSKLVSSMNDVLRSSEEEKGWAIVARGQRPSLGNRHQKVRTADIRETTSFGRDGAVRLHTWRLYWIDGRWIKGDVEAKLWQAVARLQGRGDDGAVVLLATHAGDAADRNLEKFARTHLLALEGSLAAARDTR